MPDDIQVYDGDGIAPGDKPLIEKVRQQVGYSINDLVSVQAMTNPVGLGYALRYKVNEYKDSITGAKIP